LGEDILGGISRMKLRARHSPRMADRAVDRGGRFLEAGQRNGGLEHWLRGAGLHLLRGLARGLGAGVVF